MPRAGEGSGPGRRYGTTLTNPKSSVPGRHAAGKEKRIKGVKGGETRGRKKLKETNCKD